jgi:hypothetical protein
LVAGDGKPLSWFKVAVNNPFLVRRRQGRGDLDADLHRLGGRELTAAAQQSPGQRLTLQVLHDEEAGAIGEVAEVGDLHQAGVADEVGGSRLVEEAVDGLGAAARFGVKDLDRDAALDDLVDGFVDGAHAACAELTHDAVGPDDSRQVAHRRQNTMICKGRRARGPTLRTAHIGRRAELNSFLSVCSAVKCRPEIS